MVKVIRLLGISTRIGSHVIWSPLPHIPCTQAQLYVLAMASSEFLMQMKEMDCGGLGAQ